MRYWFVLRLCVTLFVFLVSFRYSFVRSDSIQCRSIQWLWHRPRCRCRDM